MVIEKTKQQNEAMEWKFINLHCQTDNLCVQLEGKKPFWEEKYVGGTPTEIFLYLTEMITCTIMEMGNDTRLKSVLTIIYVQSEHSNSN